MLDVLQSADVAWVREVGGECLVARRPLAEVIGLGVVCALLLGALGGCKPAGDPTEPVPSAPSSPPSPVASASPPAGFANLCDGLVQDLAAHPMSPLAKPAPG